MTLKTIIELFDKKEVKELYKGMQDCIEYVRLDVHIFNSGYYVSSTYSNDVMELESMEGCAEYAIIDTSELFDIFMLYASDDLKNYYSALTE